jgi:hypothetical protein
VTTELKPVQTVWTQQELVALDCLVAIGAAVVTALKFGEAGKMLGAVATGLAITKLENETTATERDSALQKLRLVMGYDGSAWLNKELGL